MPKFKHVILVLAVLWTAFIVYGLVTTPSEIPRFEWLLLPGMDKLIHLVLFGVEAVLLGVYASHGLGKQLWIPILVWCFMLGAGLEIIQYYWVDGRSGDVFDLLADVLGAGLGLLVNQLFLKK